MADRVKLYVVAPEMVPQFWPYCEQHIKEAMRRGDISDYAYVGQQVFNDSMLLWIAYNGALNATAITELDHATKRCTIVALGGKDLHAWLPFLADLERYAKANGCKTMRAMGRKGWARLLKDYKQRKVI